MNPLQPSANAGQASLLPPTAGHTITHDRRQSQQMNIKLPSHARPGMKLQVQLTNGQTVQVAVPPGCQPGQTIPLTIRSNNVVDLSPHPGRQLPRDAETGQLVHSLRVEGVREPGGPVHPIQDARAEMARTYQSARSVAAGRGGGSLAEQYFRGWTKQQMVRLLVENGTEIKGERRATSDLLVAACAQQFGDQIRQGAPPLAPANDQSFAVVARKMMAARTIQLSWVKYQYGAAHVRMMERAAQDARLQSPLIAGSDGPSGTGEHTFHSYQQTHGAHYHRPQRGPEAVDVETGLQSHEHLDKVLEQEWVKPTVGRHQLHGAEMHRFRNSPQLILTPGAHNTNVKVDANTWCGSNTGRHCTRGGCGEQLDYWDEGMMSDFSQFGPGIVLYFKFVKWLYWTLGIVSLLFLPMMIINSRGVGIPDPTMLNSFALTTLGNLGDPSNSTHLKMPGCGVYNYILDNFFEDETHCILKKQEVGIFYTFIDAVAVVFLCVAIVWLREFEETEVSYLDKNTVSPSDFTIYIPTMPSKIEVHKAEAEIKRLKEKILKLKARGARHQSFQIQRHGGVAPKRLRTAEREQAIKLCLEVEKLEAKEEYVTRTVVEQDIQDFFNLRNTTVDLLHLHDTKVIDVNFGFDNGDLIDMFKKRGKLMFEHFKIGHQIRYWRSRSKALKIDTANPTCYQRWCTKEYSDTKEETLIEKRKAIKKEMDGIDKIVRSNKNTWRPLTAFVSFNTEHDFMVACKQQKYSMLKKFLNYLGCPQLCCVRPEELFGGSTLLKARPAPEPSTIIWEHMKYSRWDRFKRRADTLARCLVMMLISIIVTTYAEWVKHSQKLEETEECPVDFAEWERSAQKSYVTKNEGGHTNLVHCYCNTLEYSEQIESSLCSDYYLNSLLSLVLQGVAINTVIGMNMFISMIINKLAKGYEKHHSMDGEEASVFSRTFLLKFINTGCLYLIVNLDFVTNILIGGDAKDMIGIDRHFSVNWYGKVAPLLVSTMLVNIGAPHAPVVLRWLRYRRGMKQLKGDYGPELTLEDCHKGGETIAHVHPLVNRIVQDKTENKITGRIVKHPVGADHVEVEWDCDKEEAASMPRRLNFADALHYLVEESGVQGITAAQKTDGIFCQDELNKKFTGADFHLHLRYGQHMVNFYVCMMFGMGIPILVPIVCVATIVAYWVDKYMFLHYYKTPPQFSHHMSFSSSKLLVYGVVLHLTIGIFMFSGDTIFSSKTFASEGAYETYTRKFEDESFFEKVTQNHVIVLTLLFCVLVSFLLVRSIFGGGFKFLSCLYRTISCSASSTSSLNRVKFNDLDVTYTKALQRCLIKGLPSYNVLLNPVYRDAFRIDMAFSATHKHVDSVTEFDMEGMEEEKEARAEQRAIELAQARAKAPVQI